MIVPVIMVVCKITEEYNKVTFKMLYVFIGCPCWIIQLHQQFNPGCIN